MAAKRRLPGPNPPGGKKLIVTCDGTWLDSTTTDAGQLEHPSNVARIGWAVNDVDRDGRAQIVFYQNGIGSQGGILRRLQGGLTGEGFKENVREAYSFIATNFAEGDEIYLLGFSRGAFTARSVAGMIKAIGLLTKEGLPYFSEIFEDYVHQRDRDYRPKYPNIPFPKKPSASNPAYRDGLEARDMTETQVTVKAIAVWETVGSLGIPRVPWLEQLGLQSSKMKGYQFYDTNLGNHIENAFQALALDEKRAAFLPAVWELPRGCTTHLKQCWFPGTHSNVGGGYPDQEIANITLAWIMAQLEPFIDFEGDYVMDQYEMNRKYYREKRKKKRPWSFGRESQIRICLKLTISQARFTTPSRHSTSPVVPLIEPQAIFTASIVTLVNRQIDPFATRMSTYTPVYELESTSTVRAPRTWVTIPLEPWRDGKQLSMIETLVRKIPRSLGRRLRTLITSIESSLKACSSRPNSNYLKRARRCTTLS